jgi:hypothetical protein
VRIDSVCVVNFVVMQFSSHIREDLQEVARLVSVINGAHSTAVFLPTELLGSVAGSPLSRSNLSQRDIRDAIPLRQVVQPGIDPKAASIDLIAVHSNANLVKDCRVQVGHGLLGWVAEQGRPIHLAPCEVSSSALAIYLDQEPVKSLVAVPIFTQPLLSPLALSPHSSHHLRPPSPGHNSSPPSSPCGVLMCDSTRVDGFTNSQVKVLEQFAAMIQKLLGWAQKAGHGAQVETSWEVFKQKTLQLGDAIGHGSIEILRIRLESLRSLEALGGISLAVQLSEQFVRLAQQAVPPHFPCIRLPDGDVALAVDDMMSGFFQQKLQTLANHLSSPDKPLQISIECYRAKLAAGGQCSVDATLQQKPISIKTSANLGGVRA